MKPVLASAAIILALVIGAVGGYAVGTRRPANQPTSETSAKAETLKMDMRKLWEDHATWTRLYIVSATANLPGTDATLARLMQNQVDIGNAIKPYYSSVAGDKLASLLKDHISLAGEVVMAAAKGDQKALATANTRWYDNANQIADFLAAANPNWPTADMRAMMKEHLDLTKQEAVDIIAKKGTASVVDYDKVHSQILQMADMLSDGIIKQHPDKFQ